MGVFIFNGLTAPGYFMFLVWLLFSVIVALTFKEPERVGLNQLKDKALSPMPSRGSSFCEGDENADGTVLVDSAEKEGAADDEKRPLLAPPDADGDNNNIGMYTAIGSNTGADADEGKMWAPIESANNVDDYTGEVTASTLDFRSFWFVCVKNFSLQVRPPWLLTFDMSIIIDLRGVCTHACISANLSHPCSNCTPASRSVGVDMHHSTICRQADYGSNYVIGGHHCRSFISLVCRANRIARRVDGCTCNSAQHLRRCC